MKKSRYSMTRLEKLLGKVIHHHEGHHLKVSSWNKTNPAKRGHVMNQKRTLGVALQSRIARQR